MPTLNTDAIILSRRDCGEADRLLIAYSKDLGGIKIMARGSRRLKSKLAAHVEPFCVGKYFLAEGKTFYILAGAEAVETNTTLSSDIERYKDASYVCELLQMVMVENQASEKLFSETRRILNSLGKENASTRKLLLRYFEFLLLSEIGYETNFTQCRKCHGKLEKEESYLGSYEGVYCGRCKGEGKKIGINALKILRVFESKDLNDVLRYTGTGRYAGELKEVTFSYLCGILPKIPKSENL